MVNILDNKKGGRYNIYQSNTNIRNLKKYILPIEKNPIKNKIKKI